MHPMGTSLGMFKSNEKREDIATKDGRIKKSVLTFWVPEKLTKRERYVQGKLDG